jgi:hypothetical protein
MIDQVLDSSLQAEIASNTTRQSAGNASKRILDPIESAIGTQPIIVCDLIHGLTSIFGKTLEPGSHVVVNFRRERFEGFVRILVPVQCEKVIVEDIDQDTARMPESASNPAAAPEYHPMRVGEGIDRLMMPYTFQKSLWHGGSRTASNHIREKIS